MLMLLFDFIVAVLSCSISRFEIVGMMKYIEELIMKNEIE